jgi:hypothetical protein
VRTHKSHANVVIENTLTSHLFIVGCWNSLGLTKKRIVVSSVFLLVALTAWAPWLTDDFAIAQVSDKLGGPDRQYNYLGKVMPLTNVPKSVVRIPFGALVYFPSEAVYFVTFFGLVL